MCIFLVSQLYIFFRTTGLNKSFAGSIAASAGTDHIYSTGYGGGGGHYALRKTINSNVVNDIFNVRKGFIFNNAFILLHIFIFRYPYQL